MTKKVDYSCRLLDLDLFLEIWYSLIEIAVFCCRLIGVDRVIRKVRGEKGRLERNCMENVPFLGILIIGLKRFPVLSVNRRKNFD